MTINLRPILVLGPGHSGTSAVCQSLGSKVCWGHLGAPYEHKQEMGAVSKDLICWRATPSQWLERLKEVHRGCNKIPGVKILWLSFITQWQLNEISPRLIIETTRERTSCVDSWQRFHDWTREEDERRYDAIRANLARLDYPPETERPSRSLWCSIDMTPERRRYTDAEMGNFAAGWLRTAASGASAVIDTPLLSDKTL